MKTNTYICAFYAILAGILSFSCSPEKGLPIIDKPEPEKLRLEKITSGPENAQNYFYNNQGLISRFSSHWNYLNSTSDLTAVIEYDSAGKAQKTVYNGLNQVRFYYWGKVLDKTEEYDHKNRLVVTHLYFFSSEGKLLELLDQVHADGNSEEGYFIKSRYEYDPKGNVINVTSQMSKAVGEKFTPWRKTHYENYDDHVNPDPGFVTYPYVDLKCIQRNNPGKITITDAKMQSGISVQQNSYTYNKQGYPTQKVERLTSNGQQTELVLDYHYQEIR